MTAAVLAVIPTPAEACQCLGEQGWGLSRPADGETGVPLNARFFIPGDRLRPEQYKVLETATLSEVAGQWAIATLDDFDVATFTPEGGWNGLTQYDVRRYFLPLDGRSLDDLTAEELDAHEMLHHRVSFETGLDDHTPLALLEEPTFTVVEATQLGELGGTSCDVNDDYRVAVEVTAPHTGVLVVLRRAGQPSAYNGAIDTFAARYLFGTTEQVFRIGTESCSAPWYDVAPGAEATFSIGVVDLSGSIWWWPDELVVRLPDEFLAESPAATSDRGNAVIEDDPASCSSNRVSSRAKPSSLLPCGAAGVMIIVSLRIRRRRRRKAFH